MWEYNNLDELYHYGILGMRWGRRKARTSSADHVRTQKLKKKKLYQLSNNELKEYNNRKEMERKYKSFDGNMIKKGAAALATTAAIMGSVVAIKSNAPQVIEAGKSILAKMRYVRI